MSPRRAPPGPACAAVVAVALAAAACTAAPAPEPVHLWAMGREGEVVQQMLPAFARRHPEVAVRVQQVPWSAAHEKLLTAFVGDALPDVFQAGSTWIPELVALGALEPLDARLAAAPDLARDDWFPGILDANLVDGATWGVPWYVDTRVLFYRADLVPDAPRSWSAWLEAMTRTRAALGPDAWAILLPLREWQPLVVLALQQGATLLRDDGRFGAFASPAFRRAFDFYLSLFRRGLAPGTGEAAVGNLYQDFAAGYFGFFVTGPWNLGEFSRRLPAAMQPRWAVAPMPAPDGTAWPGVSVAGGSSLVLARGSRRKDAAWRLVAWLAEPAQQATFHRLSGDLPARRSAWPALALDRDPRAAAFLAQLDRAVSTPKVPEWERIAAKITEHAEAAVRGLAPPDAALAALDRDVDRLLEKRRWLLARRSGDATP